MFPNTLQVLASLGVKYFERLHEVLEPQGGELQINFPLIPDAAPIGILVRTRNL